MISCTNIKTVPLGIKFHSLNSASIAGIIFSFFKNQIWSRIWTKGNNVHLHKPCFICLVIVFKNPQDVAEDTWLGVALGLVPVRGPCPRCSVIYSWDGSCQLLVPVGPRTFCASFENLWATWEAFCWDCLLWAAVDSARILWVTVLNTGRAWPAWTFTLPYCRKQRVFVVLDTSFLLPNLWWWPDLNFLALKEQL